MVYGVTIDVAGDDVSMFEVMGHWRNGTEPRVAIATHPADNVCL